MGEQNQVLGFSYGAVIALLTADTTKSDKLYLCSLSPNFKEDQETMSSMIKKYIGKRRYADVATRSAIKITKEINTPTVIFYGEKEGTEYPSLMKRCAETAKNILNGKLVVVPNAPHKINFPTYQAAVINELRLT